MSSSGDAENEEFFRYSGGRWLWDEEKQLRDRYKRFNISELKNIAAKTVGSHACVSMIKLAEGGFNKVFRLMMDDGNVVIARIPNPNAGPSFRTTASEVATIDFARDILAVPVPKVLSWSGNANNPVESEYILMEEANGTPLHELWDGFELHDKLKIVDEIVALEKKLLSISFTRYGNLYYAADAFPGCEKAEIDGEALQSQRDETERRFAIGPVVDTNFWIHGRGGMKIDRGPWKHPEDYLKAIGLREIEWLRCHAAPKHGPGMFSDSAAQNTPSCHIALYEKFISVADALLPKKRDLVRSTLWHWDIRASNLFVRNGQITSVIDWQDVWAGPLFLQARHPHLIRYNGEVMLKLPPKYEGLADEAEKARIRAQVEKSLALWVYESETRKSNPILHELFHMPQWHLRRDAVNFAANTWERDIVPFRECLIRIVRHWNEITNETPCPISFTDEELEAHYRDAEGWNEQADFWDSLEHLVHRDGWTSNETYDQALELFAELREQGLQNLSGEERRAFEQQTRWASRANPKVL
ncbi:hypothetical protein G647_10214 [Cladophialophora carrionii CBS 160.54]|uniref:Aminoglycoside phosphotransferase domain-containing protein n=1 Tax=Cladophialophora carrionii CBS 160.54 TaxID=1279043 RepID=V9DIN8_9EURO|nr:uncharacterized protein G647_10214 [Cladophialophora carrionii CBS 160.54]ETI26769.1 hypothetical protein G647_10214 [Cladophialophora carrionii CBS 160.54]